jgi:competence protein ComGC
MKKLKETKGETLSEVLIASLVIALALILLVNMVTASSRLVSKSSDVFDENMQVKNSVEYGFSDSSDTTGLTTSDGTLTISGGTLKGSTGDFTWSGKLNDTDVTVLKDDDTSVSYTKK